MSSVIQYVFALSYHRIFPPIQTEYFPKQTHSIKCVVLSVASVIVLFVWAELRECDSSVLRRTRGGERK